MKTSQYSELKSHPRKALEKHLQSVADISLGIIQSKKLEISTYIDYEILCEVCYLIGLCHDFGKATASFQEYINLVEKYEDIKEESSEKKTLGKRIRELKNRPENKHGHISAVFTYHVIKEYLKGMGKPDWQFYEYLPILSYLIVRRHHGNLKDALMDVKIFDQFPVLNNQIKQINHQAIRDIYGEAFSVKNVKLDIGDFFEKGEKYLEDIRSSQKLLMNKLKNQEEIFYYVLSLLLYSILLDADKKDAIFSRNPVESRVKLQPDLVDKYRKIEGFDGASSGINKIRNEIYNEVLSQVSRIPLQNRIYSLNVPTGTGKTLTSLSFALKLRERIEQEKGYLPRLIYSLPFMSIIDQNFEVFEDVFTKVQGEKPKTDTLLKHHHLSGIAYETRGDGEDYDFDTNESLFLIEGWNSEIVVTTFVQFFHTLVSNNNKAIRKYHNIANSIVILDEIQSVPHKYWLLLNKVLEIFSETFNTYFILVTATQPLIFSETEISSLVKDSDSYFKKFNRITLTPECRTPKHLDEFKETVKKKLESDKDDVLVVLNTIKSSKEVHESIESNGFEAEYLSTNIIPKERLARIKKIKETQGKARQIIVSTQLIEAGVDIDVDAVYRDLGPLDSINQVCGRCNRNFSKGKKGEVFVFTLKDDKKEYQKYIYDSFLIGKTMDVLKDFEGKDIEEDQFLKLNNEYFKKVKNLMSEDESKKIIGFLESLSYGEIKQFKLIEDDYSKLDVFIEVDDTAPTIWSKFLEIKAIKDLKERRSAFLEIKKDFYEYVIAIPEKSAVGLKDENYEKYGICHIPHSMINNYYNTKTGYKLDDAGCGTFSC